MATLSVAVVGSGPAGLYTAEALVKQAAALESPCPVAVDVIDRLPCPYGLVRYGVAPDHEKIKSITLALRKVLETDGIRFLGNVDIGNDVSMEELHEHYDAIVVAYGARSTAGSTSTARSCPAASPPPTSSPGTAATPTPRSTGSPSTPRRRRRRRRQRRGRRGPHPGQDRRRPASHRPARPRARRAGRQPRHRHPRARPARSRRRRSSPPRSCASSASWSTPTSSSIRRGELVLDEASEQTIATDANQRRNLDILRALGRQSGRAGSRAHPPAFPGCGRPRSSGPTRSTGSRSSAPRYWTAPET